MFCRAGVLFPRKKEKAPDPISYGTEDFRGATHVAGIHRPLLCAVRGAPPGSSPQAPKVEKRFCPAGFHQPPALSEGAAAASFFMAYMGIVYPIFLHSASPVPGLSYCAPAPNHRTEVSLCCPARQRRGGPAAVPLFAMFSPTGLVRSLSAAAQYGSSVTLVLRKPALHRPATECIALQPKPWCDTSSDNLAYHVTSFFFYYNLFQVINQ